MRTYEIMLILPADAEESTVTATKARIAANTSSPRNIPVTARRDAAPMSPPRAIPESA